MDKQAAIDIAVKSLHHLGQDENELLQFVMASGVDISDINDMASTDAFLTGVLDYYMGNEPLLLAFTSVNSIDPADVSKARQAMDAVENVAG